MASILKHVNQKLAVSNTPETIYWSNGETFVSRFSLIVDRYTYLWFDSESWPGPAGALPIKAGESFSEDGVTVHRLAFVNVVPGEQPLVRGVLWG